MNYSQILRRSWEILKNNKFLWGLGILAGLVSGGGGIPSFNFPSSYQSAQPTPAVIETLPTTSPVNQNMDLSMASAGRILGDAVQKSKCITRDLGDKSLGDKCGNGPVLTSAVITIIGLCVLLGIVVGLIILYFGTSARAGLILAVDKLETTGEKMGFKKALNEGKKYFWRIFGAGLLYSAYVLFFLAICGALIGIAILLNNTVSTVVIVLIGVVLFIAFLVSCLYLGVLYLFIAQIIVLGNFGPIEALKKAHLLVKSQWRDVLISWIIMIGIGFAMGLVIVLSLLIVGTILALVGFGIYGLAGVVGAVIFGIIFGTILFVVLFIIRGFVTAYMSIFTTLVYRALYYIQAQKFIN
ncbi:MAG: hypothetical protein Q7S57_02110 [bacterium]|nr:hypothetical protein [bacterium]